MTQQTIEKNKALISIFGEEKVEAAYEIIGGVPVSMAALTKFIKQEKIKNALKNRKPSRKLAKELGVGFSTLYKV